MSTTATKRALVPLDKKPKAATSLLPLIETISGEMEFPAAAIHLLVEDSRVGRSIVFGEPKHGHAAYVGLVPAIVGAKGSVVHQWDQTGALVAGIALLDEGNHPFAVLTLIDEGARRWTLHEHDKFVSLAQSAASQVRWFTLLERQLFEQYYYEELFRNAADAIFICNLDGNFTAVNHAFASMTGYSRAKSLELNLADLVIDVDEGKVRLLKTQLLGGGSPADLEITLMTADSVQVVLSVRARLMTEMGRPCGFQGFARDVTENRLTQRALEVVIRDTIGVEGEEFLRTLVVSLSNVIPDCFCFVSVAESKVRTGRTSVLAIGGVLQPNISYCLDNCPCGAVIDSGELFVPKELGARFPNEPLVESMKAQSYFGIPLRDAKGESVGVFGLIGLKQMMYSHTIQSVVRVFARRAAAELDREHQATQRHTLASLVENSGELIAMVDLLGHCFYINSAGRELLGATDRKIESVQWQSLFAPGQDQVPTLQEIKEHGRLSFSAGVLPANGSSAIQVQLECFLVLDPAKTDPLGVAIIGRDLRSAIAAREALLESEEKHRTAVAALSEGVLLVNTAGVILAANESVSRMFETSAESLIGRSLGDEGIELFREDASRIAFNELPTSVTATTGAAQSNVIIGVKRCNQKYLWLSLNSQPILTAGTSVPHTIVVSFTDITEKRQAQSRLREFSEGLRELHRLSTINTQNQRCFLDDALATGCKLLGMSHGAIVEFSATGQPLAVRSFPDGLAPEALPAEAVRQVQTTFIRELSETEPAIFSTPIIAGQRSLGTLTLFSYTASAQDRFSAEQNEILELLAKLVGRNLFEVLMDKERKKAEQELLRSEQQFRSLIEDAADFICVLDESGRLSYASPSFVRELEISPNSWLGAKLLSYVEEADRNAFAEGMERWRSIPGQHAAVDFCFRSARGRIVHVEAVANNLLADSDVRGIVINSRDITQRRVAEEKLRLLESAIAEAHDAVVVVTPSTSDVGTALIRYANPAMRKLYSRLDEPLAGQPVSVILDKLTPNNQKLGLEIGSTILQGQSAQAVFELDARDGSPRWFDVRCEPILDGAGKLLHCIAVLRDISIQRRTILLEQDRNRILELIGRNATTPEIMTSLASMVERQIPNSYVSVLQVQGIKLTCEAAPSLPAEYHQAIGTNGIALAAGICWNAVLNRTRAIAEVALQDQFWAAFPELRAKLGIGKCLAQPVFSATGKVLGVLSVLYRSGTDIDRYVECIQPAASIAGIALEHRIMTDTLAYQAKHDSLTGLPNRNHLESLLPEFIQRVAAEGKYLGVGFLDLDRFKPINDSLGHSIGDLLLEQVGARLQSAMSPGEVLARVGGDEFVILFTGFDSNEEALEHGHRILEKFHTPFTVEGYDLFLTASMGLSIYPRDGEDGQTLLRNADHAMYRAKNLGKNELELYAPTAGSSPAERLEMESHLRRALDRRELRLNYHPLVTLDGTLYGFEALLSWQHPELGRIAPADFIPIAEESGLIISIGAWVLEQACLQLAAWLRAGYAISQISVNVSPLQFARPDFVDIVASALAVSGLDPRYLTLEITESMIMRNIKEAAAKMALLRAVGLGIAIDDFGTGYSSLNYLSQLPADQLKIDQSFLRDMTSQESTSFSVVQTITTLAHSLRLRVIAEGVELPEQLELLKIAGCDLVQGHLFGEPLAVFAAEQLLKKRV